MGFWELLDNGGISGKCETKYFHIYIYKDLPDTDIFNYEDAVKGTLMHEYLHYLQFVNTPFGILHGTAYNNYFSWCVDYFKNNEEIEIPLNIRSEQPDLDALIKRLDNLIGSKTCSLEIDQVVVELEDIDKARNNGTAVLVKGINSESGESEVFEFGYLSIIEGMALVFQSFFDQNIAEHPVVPYHAVEIILKNLAKPITDKKLIFSICLCALMFENPAVDFFTILKILEVNPRYDGIKLYSHLLNSNISNARYSVMRDLFSHQIDEYQANIEAAINCDLTYFSKVFENCKLDIQNQENFLLRLIYETEINSKEFIEALINHYGLPLIEANNLTLTAKSPDSEDKGYLDLINLRELEMVIRRFTSTHKTHRECPLFEKCNSLSYRDEVQNKFEMSYECLDEQWKKQEKCLMTVSLRKYSLDKKVIIQKSFG